MRDKLQVVEQPVRFEDFEVAMRRFEPFELHPTLIVAVSGGPDSLALCVLANCWCKIRRGRLIALTVDHGLRPNSTQEATQTRDWLYHRQIRTVVVRLRSFEKATAIQDQARTHRLRVMDSFARRVGALHTLVGHHADDQTETVAMRRARASSGDGLAGIPSVRELHWTRLLRPLLGFTKDQLSRFLAEQNQEWLEDPSNRDVRFERARLRKRQLYRSRHADWPRQQRQIREVKIAKLAATQARVSPFGYALIRRGDSFSAISEEFIGLLTRVMATIAGTEYRVSHRVVVRALFNRMNSRKHARVSLGGCIVRLSGTDDMVVVREPGRVRTCKAYREQGAPRWDSRFIVEGLPPAALLGALRDRGWAEIATEDRHKLCSMGIERDAALSWPLLLSPDGTSTLLSFGAFELGGGNADLLVHFRPKISVLDVPFDRTILV